MGTYTKLYYHIVFGTKYRHKTIRKDLRDDLYNYIGGTLRGKNGHLIEIGGVDDHLHVFMAIPPNISVSDAVRDLKSNTSKWINDRPDAKGRFEWQKGYAAFTVSFSQRETVVEYLCRQQEHHRTKSFKEEYIEFLKPHEIPFEEKYLFEGEFVG